MQTDTKGKETLASVGLNWRNKPRRMFTPEQRLAMVQQCQAPGVSIAEVAQRNRVNTNLLFKWKRLHERGELAVPASSAALVPVTVVKSAKRRARTGATVALGRRQRSARSRSRLPEPESSCTAL